MSDFLRHLAGRELGVDAVLRPRLPSRFETGFPAAFDPGPEFVHEAPARPAPAIGEGRPLPAVPARAQGTREPPALPSLRAPDAPSSSRQQAAPAVQTRHREPAPQDPSVPQPAGQATDTASGTAPVAAAAPAPRLASPLPALRVRTRIADAGTRFGKTDPSALDAPPPAPAPPDRKARHVAGAPRSPALRPDGPTPATAGAPDTIVQVHIGRIEVHATPPARAPARRHDAPRPSSLEDYLRARGTRDAG